MSKVTQTEFAKHPEVNVSQPRIAECIKNGRLFADKNGKLDLEESLLRWKKYHDPSKVRKNKKPAEANKDKPKTEKEFKKKLKTEIIDSDILDYDEAKYRKEKYNAMYRKLEYEEKLGTLVSKDEIKSKYFSIIRNFRDEIMTIPTRLSASFSSHIVEFIRNKMRGDFTEEQIELLLKKLSVNEIEHVAFTDWKRESENALNELEKLRK